MRPSRFVTIAALAALLAGPPATGSARTPDLQSEDVTRFFQVYEAAGGHPSAEQLDRDYLAPGTQGLHEFAQLRNVTGARIAAAIAANPGTYTGARRCLAVLPAVKRRLTAALTKLSV